MKQTPFGGYDPFKYKDTPPPTSAAPQPILELDPIFHDDPHYTWKAKEKELAERYLPEAIDSLTLPQRGVYLRRREQGMAMEEIAAELGISRQAAYQRYDRAKERIKEFLKKMSQKR
jgi:RNA polymerase sigma factor (sigma-70 family)